jgi:para-nitrobenzyl esterase
MLTAAADRRSALRVTTEVQRRWRSFRPHGCLATLAAYTDTDRAVMVFDRKSSRIRSASERRMAWEGFTLAR